MNHYDIIEKPILSEKSFEGIKDKTYTFRVHPKATKTEIKEAVEKVFGKGIKVDSVRTAKYDGKPKKQGRTEGKRSDWKKAYVTLTSDSKSIEFFDGLQ